MRLRRFVLVLPAAFLLMLLSGLFALHAARTGPGNLLAVQNEKAGLQPGAIFWRAAAPGDLPREDEGSAHLPASVPDTIEASETSQISLSVSATVGVERDVCATTRRLRVFPGTRVYFCYSATNTGNVTLTRHSITDTRVAGDIWSGSEKELSPGATLNTVTEGPALPLDATGDTQVEVTWVATGDDSSVVTATASASVDVITPALQVTKTVGISPTLCAGSSRVTVPAGGDVQYCLVVANTGEITFASHRLDDSSLGLSGSFTHTLGPSQRLTITEAALGGLGIKGSLVRTDVTRTVTNTVHYTATTVDGYALGNAGNAVVLNATASDVATATAALATAHVAFTKTIGTQESVCADTTSLSVSDPNTSLYYCAILHNTGGITLTRHVLAEPRLGLRVSFTHTLGPDDIYRITNDVLDNELDLPRQFGPYTLYYGDNLTLDFTMVYTGSVPATESRPAYTATASANAFAGLNVTRTPTPTFTPTRNSSNSSPTNTPWPTSTPTWTPIPFTATPTPTDTPPFPTETPTPTRSYAISLLETPTSVGLSPLETPYDEAAALETLAAQGTLAALEATAAALSPLAPPSETPTPPASPLLPGVASPAVAIVVVTSTPTPLAALAQRPVVYPTPTSTPDVLLFAALVADKIMLAAGWIWFALGSLVFFAVAGLVAGLSFRQAERRRFELHNTDVETLDAAGFLPPPSTEPDEAAARAAARAEEESWPDSLP